MAAHQQGNQEPLPELRHRRRERAPIVSPARTSARIVARWKNSLVFLEPAELWAFEAADRMTFVHSRHGRFEIDVSLAVIEASSIGRSFTRVHRNWLISVPHIKQLERSAGQTAVFVGTGIGDQSQSIRVPVSRLHAQALRGMLLANAIGVRR
jgi:DNA-binding LytR/AlgR family response regulator